VAASGPNSANHIALQLGDSVAELQSTSSLPLKNFDGLATFTSDTPINIDWQIGPQHFVFSDVGGTGDSVLQLDLGIEDNRLDHISFAWQNRPLKQDEAVEKARQFQQWLLSNGFQPEAAPTGPNELPFSVWMGGKVTGSQAADWTSAKDLLADETQNVETMHMYTLVSSAARVSVTIENYRRKAWDFAKNAGTFHDLGPDQRQSVYDSDGGYEWFLEVDIARPEQPPTG
jgi:hypothetical protein